MGNRRFGGSGVGSSRGKYTFGVNWAGALGGFEDSGGGGCDEYEFSRLWPVMCLTGILLHAGVYRMYVLRTGKFGLVLIGIRVAILGDSGA